MRFSEFKTLQEASSLLKVPASPSGSEIANLQKALAAFNYNVNTTGEMDDLTTAAISKAQQEMGLPVTGKPDATTIDAMNGAIKQVPGMSDYMSKGALPSSLSIVKSEPAPSKPEVKSKASVDVGAELEPSRSGPAPTTASAKGREVIIGNERRTGGSISWRTNNPGNIAYSGIAKSYGALGYIRAADGEPVAIMPTLEDGLKLQMVQWRRPKYNNLTINQACRTWATGVGKKTGTSQYTIDMANAAGASIHTKVSDLSDEQLKNMLKKQAKLEGFKVGTVTTV
jgi:peptidoglycan hydrolase-like protein with peptidoglycan-binding domain